MHDKPLDWRQQPLFGIRAARDAAFVAGVIGLFYVCWQLRSVTVPALLAFSVAVVFEPVVAFAARARLPRALSAALLLLLVVLLVGLMLALGLPKLFRDLSDLNRDLPAQLQELGLPQSLVSRLRLQVDQDLWWQALLVHWRQTSNWMSRALGVASSMLLILAYSSILFVFFVTRMPQMPRAERYVPRRWAKMIEDFLQVFQGYLRGQLIVAAWTTAGFAIGFSLVGVPYALVAAAIGGLFSFVPNGQMSGWLLALAFGAIEVAGGQSSSWIAALLYPTLVYLVTQSLESFIITPWVQGKALRLHPLYVLTALVAGLSLGGLLGVFFAIPLAACVRILLEKIDAPALKSRGASLDAHTISRL